ncbi:hypothetical protein LTR84_007211 [Exophiala bonariae]|uniref:Short-chain dehydrogenase n=1 Tax=Exophiala bonariae TaxID=1690606 RepID=A0AAV9MYS1_9EURO|nr:hypothetical protein LTR84_007211 [Exophiala bonariae]
MPGLYKWETTAEEVIGDLESHITGKVILTTGVSPGGLGAAFVEQIAVAEPKLLILAGRNKSKVEATAAKVAEITNGKVETRILELDLGSLDKVREAAAVVNTYSEPIDVLVNNAGIMATEYAKTTDGFEGQFGTNHLAPWLFTNLIMDKILKSSLPRVVNVSSDGYRLSPIRFYDYGFKDGKTYNKYRAYGQAKTANMLIAISLSEKLGDKGLVALSLHPGVIVTNLGAHLDWNTDWSALNQLDKDLGNYQGDWTEFPRKTPSQGVATHIRAAFDPTLKDYNGRFLSDVEPLDLDEIQPHAISSREAKKLWKLSEELVGQKFEY